MNKQALELVLPSDQQKLNDRVMDVANAGLGINSLAHSFLRDGNIDLLNQAQRLHELQGKALQRAAALIEKKEQYEAGYNAGHASGHARGFQAGADMGYERGVKDAQTAIPLLGQLATLASGNKLYVIGTATGGMKHAAGDR